VPRTRPGQWRTLKLSDPRVLAIEACWRDGRVVTLHNLSAEPAAVHLPDYLAESAQASEVRQVLGDAQPPPQHRPGDRVSGYGFRWLRLLDESPATPPE
jgi:maltose alpha-D-glucosyltransferase / alpha-amylase